VQQLTIGKIDPKNEFKKIRNAETGKFAVKKNAISATLSEDLSVHYDVVRVKQRKRNAIFFHG
jgi:2C-methyl-D-erythritol 2,4-cyclodiphosphate synthase